MEETLNRIVSKYGDCFTEAACSIESNEMLTFDKKELLYPQKSESQNLVVRVTFPNGRMGVSTTKNVSDWKTCLNNARKIAKTSLPDALFRGLPGKSFKKRGIQLFDKVVRDFSVEDLMSECGKVVSVINDSSVDAQAVRAVKSFSKYSFANSQGCFNNSESCAVSAGVSVLKNGVSGDESGVFTRKPDFLSVARSAVRKCLQSQNPVKIGGGSMPLILEYDAIEALGLEMLENAFNAFSVFKDKSFLSGRQGAKVFSDKISIVDDPLVEYGLSSSLFDGEGVASAPKVLADKGVVKSFLQDNYTRLVRAEGVGGNCDSIISRPSIGVSNLVIKPGSASYEHILNSFDKALLVLEVGGAHMVNTISGDFSNEAYKAFLVEKGELKPVSKAMIAGNFFELLKKVEVIGRDSKQNSDLVSPTLAFSEVQVVT